MSKSTTHDKSHDKFFKYIFSQQSRAKSFLKGILPDSLLEQLDWNSLEMVSENFVDEKLKANLIDLVYQCKVNEGDVYISFLLEHKSYAPKFPHLQLLRYLVNIWERQVQNKGGMYPVIPIVVYHGLQTWEQKPLQDLIVGMQESLEGFVPNFDYYLFNIQDQREDDLENQFDDFLLSKSLLLMKHIFSQDQLKKLFSILKGFEKRKQTQSYSKFLRIFVLYTGIQEEIKTKTIMRSLEAEFEYWEVPEDHWLREWFEEFRQKLIDRMKQKAVEEGLAQGMEKGIAQGIEKGIAQGVAQGIAQGREEGLELGMQEGLKEGLKEGMNLILTIVNMHMTGKPIKDIAAAVKKEESEVVQILQQMNLS